MTRKEFFQKLNTSSKWDVGVSINRSNALPLDANSVFQSKEELDNYAAGNPSPGTLNNAYPGQIVAVVNSDSTVVYYIDQDMKAQPAGVGLVKGDMVLSLDGPNIKSTLSLNYDEKENKIKLLGTGDTLISEIDASNFLVDSMLEDVVYDSDDNTITFKWRTSAGLKEDVVVLTDILDPYEAGNGIQIDGVNIQVKLSKDTENYLKVTKNGLELKGLVSEFEGLDRRIIELENIDVDKSISDALRDYSTTTEVESSISASLLNYAKKDDLTNYFKIEDGYRIIDGGRIADVNSNN